MRVYFNGSFSNGKTTCRKWVAKEYNLKDVPEVARTVLAEREIKEEADLQKLRTNTSHVYEVQREIISRQLQIEKEYRDNFVSCRGLDSLAFFIAFGSPLDITQFMKGPVFTEYLQWIKHPSVYTFLIKPDVSLLKNDGFRDTNWDLSLEIYGIVKSILRTNQVSYTLISDSNMSERQTLIQAVLSNYLPIHIEEPCK